MVVVAQLGARMHYAVPAILERSGMLGRLYTDIYSPPLPGSVRKLALRYGPRAVRRLLGRIPTDIPADKIVSFPSIGLEYFRRQKSATSPGDVTAAHIWAGKELCRRVIRRGFEDSSSVYAYNSAGLELLEYARGHGLRTMIEQASSPTKIFAQLSQEEETAYPQWRDSDAKGMLLDPFVERELREWNAADAIICGSEFVREGIRKVGGPVERCVVVPYGIRTPSPVRARLQKHEPLRVLIVGAVRIMKGPHYALAAAKALRGRAEFRLAGQLDVIPQTQKLLSEHVALLGAVPRSEIHRQFEWADVFLLPTLCEGSATVCYEALAYGLPVITTPNAGSVVRDGVDGFVVPIRDVAVITDRLERLAGDEHLWAMMSKNAETRAAEFTVEKYGVRLLNVLQAVPAMAN